MRAGDRTAPPQSVFGSAHAGAAVGVLVADDDDLFRACVGAMVACERDLEIVGEASDGAAAIRLVGELEPDVVVMDIDMPGMDGLTAARALSARSPQPAIIVVTGASSGRRKREAFAAGARAFVTKGAPEELLGTLKALHSSSHG